MNHSRPKRGPKGPVERYPSSPKKRRSYVKILSAIQSKKIERREIIPKKRNTANQTQQG